MEGEVAESGLERGEEGEEEGLGEGGGGKSEGVEEEREGEEGRRGTARGEVLGKRWRRGDRVRRGDCSGSCGRCLGFALQVSWTALLE